LDLDFSKFSDATIKTQWIVWNPKEDKLEGRATPYEQVTVTKRVVCPELAKIFDSLVLLCPITTTAKIFMQRLWPKSLCWDTELDKVDTTHWQAFQNDSQILATIELARCPFPPAEPTAIQLHIFSDASEVAYGTAAYLRSITCTGSVVSSLLCAKSGVAPLAKQTLPRLELCAAVLGAELAERIQGDLMIRIDNVQYWMDSTIVLTSLVATASSFHTFVANRIVQIHEFTSPEQWAHVSSEDNPEDPCVKRVFSNTA